MAAILVGVSGGIAAYKAPDIISALGKRGHTCRVVMTEAASHFIPEMSLAVSSGSPVTTTLWDELDGSVNHIELAKWADAIVIVPATANIIGKVANGIADDVLSTVCCAVRPGTRRFVFPAMNTAMWTNRAVQRNCATLDDMGWEVVSPAAGRLACNDVGKGKLPGTREIVDHIDKELRFTLSNDAPIWPLPGVPYESHPRGKFGVVRKFDRHTGIDLYAPEGAGVVSMTSGVLHYVGPFTGPDVVCDDYPEGSNWWLPTNCVVVESPDHKFVLYGEITVDTDVQHKWDSDRHKVIEKGSLIGYVKRVLRHDKGTPVSMLHVEQLRKWTSRCPVVWGRDDRDPPEELLDPTSLIVLARRLQ